MNNENPDLTPEPVAGKQTKAKNSSDEAITQDDDFVVTESSPQPQDLVGVTNKKEADDDLGIQTTTTLMDESASDHSHISSADDNSEKPSDDQPIGSSTPMLHPDLEETPLPGAGGHPVADTQKTNVRHLSEKEVKSIRSRLYAETEQPAPTPEPERAKPVPSPPMAVKEPPPFGNTPIVPQGKQARPEKQTSGPVQSQPETKVETNQESYSQRSVARFYNNFIHLPSGTKIRENDEFTLRNKRYVAKRKNITPGLVLGAAAPIFIILALLAVSLFVGGDTGAGRVFGVVVDDYGVPYGGGATVRFPDLGMNYQADVQGLFATDPLPAGSHQVEYIVAGTMVGTGFVTLVDNDITRLILAPSAPDDQPTVTDLPSPVPAKPDYSAPPAMADNQTPASKPKASAPKPKSAAAPPKEAKLILAANVEGATLKIDGKVVGIGNTTYTRLTPGKRKYSVTRKGFDTVTGTIDLKAGSKPTIEVQLSPISNEAKAEVFTAEDYFYSAEEFASSGKVQFAIDDYSRAIDLNPGYSEAYARRGAAYSKQGQKRSAFDDFLRAGEIYQIQRSYSRAASSFSDAIQLYPKAIEPYLGRGHTLLSTGQNIAAITDFEAAVDIDKNSPAARFGLGVARFNHGQYKKAVKEFKKARSIDPGNPATHQYLMLAYLARNDTKNVKKSYDKFLQNASEEQVVSFHSDKRFTAVVRIIDMED